MNEVPRFIGVESHQTNAQIPTRFFTSFKNDSFDLFICDCPDQSYLLSSGRDMKITHIIKETDGLPVSSFTFIRMLVTRLRSQLVRQPVGQSAHDKVSRKRNSSQLCGRT